MHSEVQNTTSTMLGIAAAFFRGAVVQSKTPALTGATVSNGMTQSVGSASEAVQTS